MGYFDRVCKAACGTCGSQVLWHWQDQSSRDPVQWTCKKCGSWNKLDRLSQWPPLPKALYIGADKHHQFKLYPLPPESASEEWAQPYSIRSFVFQASREMSGCYYTVRPRGRVMGETVFSDRCFKPGETIWGGDEGFNCHLVAGWTTGQAACPLWEKISCLCQTETEQKFLHWYLGLAKDRQFPMLIPQVRIGIAERRRPDFVAFIPIHHWNYKMYAIQLDKAHSDEMALADELRNAEISMHGYEVISLKPEKQGYFEEVRKLVERIEYEMNQAESDPWSTAVEIKVKHTAPSEET